MRKRLMGASPGPSDADLMCSEKWICNTGAAGKSVAGVRCWPCALPRIVIVTRVKNTERWPISSLGFGVFRGVQLREDRLALATRTAEN